MRWWSWIVCLLFIFYLHLHLHSQPLSSLSSSSLLLLLLRKRERMRNGRMDWVGAASAELWSIQFRAYDMWGQGLSGGQLIPHSLHAVQVLTDGPVWRRTIRYSLLVEGWIQTLGSWHWGQLTLFQRPITWPLTIWANEVHRSVARLDRCGRFTLLDCELPHWVEKQCIHGFCCIQMPTELI